MKLNLHPKVIPKDTPPSPLTKGGVVVGMKKEGDKEKIYFVGDDCHLLCVGATRSGKSRCLVLESICLLGLAGESIFCSDPKAELFHYTSEFLKKLGYEVLVLDFKNPAKSMRYNLLQPVIDAINEGDTDRAEMLAWDRSAYRRRRRTHSDSGRQHAAHRAFPAGPCQPGRVGGALCPSHTEAPQKPCGSP